MTSKSKNTSNPIEAVKRPEFRFSNSPPPAISLSDWKACYTSKHGEVVEPLITDHKSRTPQPRPIMSTTTTISSGVQEVPVETTPAPDDVHSNSHTESVGIQSVVSGTDYDPIQEPQPPRDPTPPRDGRNSDWTPQQSPRPSPRPPVEGGGGGGGDPNPDHSDDSSDQDCAHDWKRRCQRKHYYYSESSDSDSDKDNVKKGIKLRDPDTYDGTNPEKLQNFLFLCSLVFKSKAKNYKSNTSKIYFALSFLWGAALEYFEPVVMADYPNKDDQPVYLLYWVEFVEELKANFGTTTVSIQKTHVISKFRNFKRLHQIFVIPHTRHCCLKAMGKVSKASSRAKQLRKGSKTGFSQLPEEADSQDPSFRLRSSSVSSGSQPVDSDRSDVESARIGLEARDDGASLSEESDDGEDSEDEELARSSLRHLYNVFWPAHARDHVPDAERLKHKKNLGKRPIIYLGDSKRTAQRNVKEQRERLASVKDCDQDKLSKKKPRVSSAQIADDQTDPMLGFPAHSKEIDISTDGESIDLEFSMWTYELEAILDGQREELFGIPDMEQFQVDSSGGILNASDSTLGDFGEVLALFVQAEKPQGLQDAREWTGDSPSDDSTAPDILAIINSLVKNAKCCKTPQAIKSLMPLTGLIHFVKLRDKYVNHPNCSAPATSASLKAAQRLGRGPYFARQLQELEPYVLKFRQLPPSKKRAQYQQVTLLDNENILQNVREYLAALKIGSVTPLKFMHHMNSVILPSLGFPGSKTSISESTAHRWLIKLGYQNKEVKKDLYIDGHERPDVVEARNQYLQKLDSYRHLMPTVDESTLEVTYPILKSREKLHIIIHYDEMSVATNEQRRRVWLTEGQQPLWKKGNGRSIYVSDFILETTGRIVLPPDEVKKQKILPLEQQLKTTDARVIIHPGKNGDPWWDNSQLMKQIENTIPIFEVLHPGAVGIWIFDCSSAHEAFFEDALNVKNMNVNPGGKQHLL
ncbi:hypothetical protein M422DRAFT_275620 [Sphaerobolus stellatus SS14]|uniref:Uncharacterized protein n=1 Tax=Sphaerobolus stellatus (strain SS14) TaxID=990650 RepID=A0A0C9T4B9_SPHS4|nr:hypothetical protein M422DRAFT_275620 [Sphaerobolus stellatus SS14]